VPSDNLYLYVEVGDPRCIDFVNAKYNGSIMARDITNCKCILKK
jgi:hypothetical protein